MDGTALGALGGALIGGVATIAVEKIRANAQKKKDDIEQDKAITDLSNKIQVEMLQLSSSIQTIKSELQNSIIVLTAEVHNVEAKVVKHNNFIERVYELEKRADVSEEKQRVANHRIDDIEKKLD